ncbi:MAG: DUF3280 domain-containing protein [Burkholderiales bacterium]
MQIHGWKAAMLAALLACAAPLAHATPTLLVLEFELIDDLGDPNSAIADQRRLVEASQALRSGLAGCDAFELAEPEAGMLAVDTARSRNQYLHRCNGCTGTIAAAAGADLVLFPWVQKVSNLILNINAEIRDAQTEAVVATRSVDIRGNNDVSWQRGVRSLVRRLCPGASDSLSAERQR